MYGFSKGLSRVRGNSHARFLGGRRLVTVAAYPIRFGEAGGLRLYQGFFGAERGRSSGVERSDRSRLLDIVNSAKTISIGLCRNGEGQEGNTGASAFQGVTDKAVLGQSFLDEGILRRHSGFGSG